MVHEIQVIQYKTIPSNIKLGTFDSYGTEKLHFNFGSGWENLAVYATFTAPNGKSVQADVDLDGNTDVPPEATAEQAGQGEIVLVGKAEGVNRITVSLHYTVLEHGPVHGAEPAVPTPDLLQQVLTLSKDAQAAAKNAEQSAKNAVKDATDTVKPFKEEAVQAAAAAALSQKSAATNAKTAADAKAAAAGSADAAAAEAQAAGYAASAAAESEQAAGASEVKAAESEKAAKASELAAAKSAQAALESKTAAAASEGNAAASAKKAKDIADSLPEDYTTAVNEIAALKTNKADQAELETVKQRVANITPDDSTVGKKPWSSKNIVDMLCPPLEESGNPVVCYPVAGYPLSVKAKWEPVQEGSGTPSPENIRPIKGRDSVTVERCGENLVKPSYRTSSVNKNGLVFTAKQDGSLTVDGSTNTLTLPETIYGGEVDAVSGDGNENTKITTLDGTTNKFILSGAFWKLPQNSSPGIQNGYDTNCSHFPPETFGGNQNKGYLFTKPQLMKKYFQDVNAFNAYLAAQYAAGTPVQIYYKLADPVPFTATGAQALPALAGVNTVLTDADSVTVTGRADPIKRIEDLEDAVASQA